MTGTAASGPPAAFVQIAKAPAATSQAPTCVSIQGSSSTSAVTVCSAVKEHWPERLAVSAPSLTVSLVALALSAWSFWYGRKKDGKSRQQSVEDDYWLRKIVSPMFTEPFVKQGVDLISGLPPHEGAIIAAVSEQMTQAVKSWQGVMESSRTLAILDKALAASVYDDLNRIEDSYVEYCGKLKAHLDDVRNEPPDRMKARELIGDQMHAVLSKIKARQISLGQ
jgi:hypothetical protein